MPPVIVDPSFEVNGGGGVWNIDIDCDLSGVAWNTTNPHSGLRCLALNSRLFGGVDICCNVYQVVSGWEVGATYRIKVWKRTSGVVFSNRDTFLLAGSLGTLVGFITSLSIPWSLHQFPTFVAYEDPMILRFIQPAGGSSTTFQRNLDDITVEKVIDVDYGIPEARGGRGILVARDVDATLEGQGPDARIVPVGPSATLRPLFTRGKPSKPVG